MEKNNLNSVRVTIFDDKGNKTVQEIQINIDSEKVIKIGNFRLVNSMVKINIDVINTIKNLNFKNARIQYISVLLNKKVATNPAVWTKERLIQYLEKFEKE